MRILALVLVMSCTASLSAQEPGEKPAAPAVSAAVDPSTVVSALGVLEGPSGCAFDGKAGVKRPNEDEGDIGGAFGGGRMTVRFGGGGGDGPGFGGGESYTGPFELVRTPEGETLLASKSGLPGFAVYLKTSRAITRTNTEGTSVNPSRLAGDLASLGTPAELIKAVKAAKLEVQSVDGLTIYKCDLPKKLIKSRRSAEEEDMPMMNFAPKVLKLTGEFRVDGQGNLAGMKITVLRSDPTAGFRRRMREAAESGEGGALAFGSAEFEDMDQETPGPTSSYDLTIAPAGPSARARSEIESLRALIAK